MATLEYVDALDENATPVAVRDLGSLADDMVYRLPGCDDVMVRKTLQAACREFCEKTAALRFRIPVPFEPGRRAYPVVAPFDCHVKAVRDMRFFHEWTETTALGNEVERRVLLPADRKWRVDPGPVVVFAGAIAEEDLASRTGFVAEVDCVPGLNCEDLPEPFLDRHGAAIVSGALARLFAMQNRPWSDPAQAAGEKLAFERAANEAAYFALGPRGADAVNYGGWA